MSQSFSIPRRSAGLYDTLWPADHADTSRRKFVVGGGLPREIDPSRIRTLSNKELPYVQWMYTREADELFCYGVPPTPGARAYLAKVDPQTLAIKQKRVLPQQIYIGGALMHSNGDVYLVHGPHIYRFPGGNLDQPISAPLPLTNGIFSQYNGMQVAEDGQLILKGWAMNVHELGMVWRFGLLFGGLGALLGVALGGLLSLLGLAPGPGALSALVLLGPLVLAATLALRTGSSWREFFFPRHTGWVIVVDNQTLKVVDQSRPPERCAYARTSLTPVDRRLELMPPHGQVPSSPPAEWYIVPGDEHILRWRYEAGKLTYDPDWTERYRTWGDGTFPGTGPCVYEGQVYYTDNTFPVGLERGYHLYRKPLEAPSAQQTVDVSPNDAGFMYFAVVVSPGEGDILIWDTWKGFLEARRLHDISQVHWRKEIRNTDCMGVAADRGHIYCSDFDMTLPSLNAYMGAAARRDGWPDATKSFVVLDAGTGKELLRLPLTKGTPNASMVVPGRHNDVFMGTRPALFRVYQE